MKFSSLLLLSCILLLSCKDPDAALRKELDTAVFKLDMLQRQLDTNTAPKSGDFIHQVFFNVKDELTSVDLDQLKEALNQLQGIEQLKSFTVGEFKHIDDPRAFSDYEVVMTMSFADEEAYQAYQVHPTHVALKEKLDRFLAAAPATYDYIQD